MSSAPFILACDTTQGACSAALYRDDVLAHALTPMRKGHAEALMPMIQTLCVQADITPNQIDRLAVTHGPGTFTGVRVGLAAMRGLALALDIPLKAYGTLHVMAQARTEAIPLIVAVDARRATFYAQAFDAMATPLGAAQALDAAAVLALIENGEVGLMGSGADLLLADAPSRFFKTPAPDYPQSHVLAAMAAGDSEWDNLTVPEPLYLRPPDASLPNREKFPARKR